jgi:SAM-dependent methyltransferase
MKVRNAAAHWDHFWSARRRAGDYLAASPRLVEQLRPALVTGCRALEVGPGTGRDAIALARLGVRVVALDSSAQALALVQREVTADSPLTLVRGDGLEAPFQDGSFDIVYHQGLLEHFRDPLPLLAENRRLLRPGGVLLVDVPQTYHVWTAIKRVAIATDHWFAGWETQYTPGELQRLVRNAGFEVLDVYGDWMSPGLAWRVLRVGLLRCGVMLPAQPPVPTRLRAAHDRLRRAWMATTLGRATAFTVGVVARRPA